MAAMEVPRSDCSQMVVVPGHSIPRRNPSLHYTVSRHTYMYMWYLSRFTKGEKDGSCSLCSTAPKILCWHEGFGLVGPSTTTIMALVVIELFWHNGLTDFDILWVDINGLLIMKMPYWNWPENTQIVSGALF
ncbi:hypothetical protein I7I53_08794 [Histoplasma capsulatum var. duboisii H88]|uniref:Uncharacterized protein n=1 Tax=Ajellomyces capsulatus (strain H88) TaxID=544711 RepID=A0A8A1L456_AJEC8|nr:hypothetical protein I7I53_08794 [Histoplasma capsulatum var. duboisii H88]